MADARPHSVEQASELWPPSAERFELLRAVTKMLDEHLTKMRSRAVASTRSPQDLRARLKTFDFQRPMPMADAVAFALDLFDVANTNMMHPGYLGLFNPSVTFAGVVADHVTAIINPQLAVWAHAPAAVEIEAHTVRFVAELFGWPANPAMGHFTSCGSEANYTAALVALTHKARDFADRGARAYTGQPRIYVSRESHLAWLKIAHQTGMGRDGVCLIATDGHGRMDVMALDRAIGNDLASGHVPVMVGATAGTTNAGMVDPLPECRDIARAHNLWFHVDAAWAGAGILCEPARHALSGIADADSITVDAHKWFAVPMGAGMFLCRDTRLLSSVFRVQASYMPLPTGGAVDPYTHTAQWSRRFIGLKLFLSLATLGIDGYRRHIQRSIQLANYLKTLLSQSRWVVINDSPVAVICFADGEDSVEPAEVADAIVARGNHWISAATFEGRSVLRACITSHFTSEDTLRRFVGDLNAVRTAHRAGNA